MADTGAEFAHEWYGQTTVHPVGLLVVLAMGAAMLAVPRRYAVWPMAFVACFVPPAQRVVVAGADFDFLRITVLFGWARVLLRGETRPLGLHRLDVALVAWAGAHLLTALVRVGPSSLMNKLGFAFDSVGMYFFFRTIVRDWPDVKQIALGFTLLAIPVAAVFAVEHHTSRNLFAVFGGVPEITAVREGRLRCQGAFAHPILAGTFWASLMPLIAAQRWDGGGRRWLAPASVIASLFIVVACASAGPLMAVVFAAIGAAAFAIRHWMRAVRWGLLLTLATLHAVMKAPVWHLISRLDLVGGSSGYHRFQIIDGAIRHADEWWLIGSDKGTGHWGAFTFDVTNYYVVQGLHGGLLLLALFVAVISFAFAAVGRTWRREMGDRARLVWSWALGVSLLVHATSFLTISYFGQINMVWYLLLAVIGSMASMPCRPLAKARPVSASERRPKWSGRPRVGAFAGRGA